MKFLIILFSSLICFGSSLTEDDFFSVKLLQLGTKLIYVSQGFKTNWHGAMDFCNSLGLRLLSINTAEENFLLDDFLKNFKPKIGTTWTSGNDIAKEGNWVWSSNGKKFEYSNWIDPQPDNEQRGGVCETENCLEVGHEFSTMATKINLYWNDARCSRKRLFICELRR